MGWNDGTCFLRGREGEKEEEEQEKKRGEKRGGQATNRPVVGLFPPLFFFSFSKLAAAAAVTAVFAAPATAASAAVVAVVAAAACGVHPVHLRMHREKERKKEWRKKRRNERKEGKKKVVFFFPPLLFSLSLSLWQVRQRWDQNGRGEKRNRRRRVIKKSPDPSQLVFTLSFFLFFFFLFWNFLCVMPDGEKISSDPSIPTCRTTPSSNCFLPILALRSKKTVGPKYKYETRPTFLGNPNESFGIEFYNAPRKPNPFSGNDCLRL